MWRHVSNVPGNMARRERAVSSNDRTAAQQEWQRQFFEKISAADCSCKPPVRASRDPAFSLRFSTTERICQAGMAPLPFVCPRIEVAHGHALELGRQGCHARLADPFGS